MFRDRFTFVSGLALIIARGEVVVIEINLLLDRLESLLVESRPVPFTANVIVDRDRCFDIINQMRVSIPEEVKKSKRVHQERDRIIAQTNEEAERILALAREQAAELVAEHSITQQAESKAQLILERTKREAQEVRYGADDYALSVLKDIEEQLIAQLTTIQNGIVALNQDAPDQEPPTD